MNPRSSRHEGARSAAAPHLVGGWLLLVIAGSVMGFAVHALRLLPGDLALALDLQGLRHSDPPLGALLTYASVPGNAPWMQWTVMMAVAIPLILRRRSIAALMAMTVTGDLMAAAVKLVVGRARPTADLLFVQHPAYGFSFPSGHVVHYVVFFGAIAYLSWRTLRAEGPPDVLRRVSWGALLALSVVLIVLVGPSRVYLGAHWPSDVLGGYLLGGAWLVLLLAAHHWWLAQRRSHLG